MQNIQKLKVIIVGAGEVGMNVAVKLSHHEKVDVTLIEFDEDRAALMKTSVNCLTIKGSGLNAELLIDAGIEDCDLFYALTDADEVNLLACQLAETMIKRSFSKKDAAEQEQALSKGLESTDLDFFQPCAPLGEGQRKRFIPSMSESGQLFLYARVRDEILYDHLQELFPHINVIFPERTCSRKIDELLYYRQAFDVVELESGRLKLYGVKIHPKSSAVGQTLLGFTADQKITIAAIARRVSGSLGHSRQLMIPSADYRMEANDEIYFAATPKLLSQLHHHFTAQGESEHPSSVVIAGDSSVALDVFQRSVNRSSRRRVELELRELDVEDREESLELTKRNLALVISDPILAERAEKSDPNGHATVVNGEITDIANLAEVGVGPRTTLLVSSSDEENLICALLARELGCDRILIVNNREQYAELINKLGFDGIFSPRQLTVNEMVHQTLKRLAKSAFEVSGTEDFEVRSFVIDKESPLCGKALKDLKSVGFPREYAVIAAMRDPETQTHIMPTGENVLSEGAVVYIVSQTTDFHKIDALFGKRRSRFRLWRS